MIAAPTFNQIKAQATAILQHASNSTAIGIHAKGRWTDARSQTDNGHHYLIDQCDSPLSFRLALQNRPKLTKKADESTIQVLITPLTDSELSDDILLRLAKQRLFPIDPWQIVKTLFHATNIDPRLIQHKWIPTVLMDWLPANRYAPVMGGFLDAEIIWPLLLKHGLGLEGDRPNLEDILRWSTEAKHITQYHQAPEDFRSAADQWLTENTSPTTHTVLQCIASNSESNALPLGLAAEVIYHPEAQNKLEKAIGKFEERFLAGHSPDNRTMQTWNKAARSALTNLPSRIQKNLIQRSDEILTDIGAEKFSYLSTVSEKGFQQQLTTFSKHLTTFVQKPQLDTLISLINTSEAIKAHSQVTAFASERRLERMDMAIRLAQWLVGNTVEPANPPKALEEAIEYHTQEGSFLDWARLTLPVSEPHRELSKAYGKLFETITNIRENQSQQFAKLLQNWTAIGLPRPSILPVEDILERIVSPLTEQNPVLFIVLDGMSMNITHELLSDLTQQNWHLITTEAQTYPIRAGLATLPSTTTVSRTSLLCGQLRKGQQIQEKKGFTKHPSLVKHCKRNLPPLLFHQKGLRAVETPNLPEEIYGVIASSKNQVVGLVINAVDDLLSKGEQVDIDWTCDRIKVLAPILQAAREAQRLVVITSDHGHIMHHGMMCKAKTGKGGERWREAKGNPHKNELKITGKRVLGVSENAIIAPWTEKLHYVAAPNKGSHGGINPQEMIVPLALLVSTRVNPQNTHLATFQPPNWWLIQRMEIEESQSTSNSQRVVEEVSFGPLFSHQELSLKNSGDRQKEPWIEQLLQSEIYQEQLRFASIDHVDHVELSKVLSALAKQDQRLSIASLAKKVDSPINNLKSLLESLQRILNIEAYTIIIYDVVEQWVSLDISLLRQQFGLER